jgi:hypothetical protein
MFAVTLKGARCTGAERGGLRPAGLRRSSPRACHRVGQKRRIVPGLPQLSGLAGWPAAAESGTRCDRAGDFNRTALVHKALELTQRNGWDLASKAMIAARSPSTLVHKAEIPGWPSLAGRTSPRFKARELGQRATLQEFDFLVFGAQAQGTISPTQELYAQPAAIPLPRAWPAQPRRN